MANSMYHSFFRQIISGITEKASSKRFVAFIILCLIVFDNLVQQVITLFATFKVIVLSDNLIRVFEVNREIARDLLIAEGVAIGVIAFTSVGSLIAKKPGALVSSENVENVNVSTNDTGK